MDGSPSDPPLYSLLYRSSSTRCVTPSDVNQIFVASSIRNTRDGVTGLLLYGAPAPHAHGLFVQWIEGPPDAVRRLWQRLQQDPRHTDLEVLHEGPVGDLVGMDARLFPGWSLRVEFEDLGSLPVTADQFLAYWLIHSGVLGSQRERLRGRRPSVGAGPGR